MDIMMNLMTLWDIPSRGVMKLRRINNAEKK